MVYPKPKPVLNTRADVFALPVRRESKAVLLWLLDQPPYVYERAQVAQALGMKASDVEVGIVALQRRHPFVLPRTGPQGEPIRGRHAFLPADAEVRTAWAAKGASPAPAPEPAAPEPAPTEDAPTEPIPADLLEEPAPTEDAPEKKQRHGKRH